MPLTGWRLVSTDRLRLPTLLFVRVPWPDLPGFAQWSDAARLPWREAGEGAHASLAILFGLLFLLHVAGALKHQLIDRDPVLARMAPGARPGRRLEPRLVLIATGALSALAFGVLVRPQAPASGVTAAASSPLTAMGSGWQVEPGSTLSFVTGWSGQPVAGRFDRWRADIIFDPAALDRARVRVVVDLASVNTGDVQRDAVLPRGDWLDVEHHAQAVFSADHFERLAADRYVAHGRLELRGVTRRLDLTFHLTIRASQAYAEGSAEVDRTAFGVGQGEWSQTGVIPARVAVAVRLRAHRGAAEK
jgi:polyisoprenoid-binding protein YceI